MKQVMAVVLVACAVSVAGCSGSLSEPTSTPTDIAVPAESSTPTSTRATLDGDASSVTKATIRINGRVGGVSVAHFFPAEWEVTATAPSDRALRFKVVNYYDPVPGEAATHFDGPHGVPAISGESEIVIQPGQTRIVRFALDAMRNGCGRQQIDILADYLDGRGWLNWIDTGPAHLIVNTAKACAAPPPVTPTATVPVPPQALACLSVGAFVSRPSVVQVLGGYLAYLPTGALPVEGVTLAVYEHVVPGQKHPQDRTYARTLTVPAHHTEPIFLPANRACSTQADVICGEAPLRYDVNNAADVDARTLPGAWDFTPPCGR